MSIVAYVAVTLSTCCALRCAMFSHVTYILLHVRMMSFSDSAIGTVSHIVCVVHLQVNTDGKHYVAMYTVYNIIYKIL